MSGFNPFFVFLLSCWFWLFLGFFVVVFVWVYQGVEWEGALNVFLGREKKARQVSKSLQS